MSWSHVSQLIKHDILVDSSLGLTLIPRFQVARMLLARSDRTFIMSKLPLPEYVAADALITSWSVTCVGVSIPLLPMQSDSCSYYMQGMPIL